MTNWGLAQIYIKQAMRQAGCPLCRCCHDAETHYLRFLLWENVNDVDTRLRLIQSLGFCGAHAQQLLQMERDDWSRSLGNSILYESLVIEARYRIRETRAVLDCEARRGRGWRILAGAGRWLSARSAGRARFVTPAKTCRVCELSHETALQYAETLADMLDYPQFREMYQRSDGICLPHLRLTLEVASPIPGLSYLLEETEARLAALQVDLGEYTRKQRSQHQAETVTHQEGTAADRAAVFFGGSSSPCATAQPETEKVV